MPQERRSPLELALFAGAYLALSLFGLMLLEAGDPVAVVWPASGLAVAILALSSRSDLGRLLGLVGTANLVAQLLIRGVGVEAPLLAGINALEAWGCVWMLRRVLGGERVTSGSHRAIRALVVAAVVAPTLAGLPVGAFFALRDAEPFVDTWFAWGLADGIGVLVVTPLIWAARSDPAGRRWAGGAELVAFSLTLATVLLVVFLRSPAEEGRDALHLSFVLFPLLLWAALRLSPRAMAAALGATTMAVAWGYLADLGPFASGTVGGIDGALLLQGFLAVATLSTLAASAVTREQVRLIVELGDQRDRLHETLAQQRTAEQALGESETRHRLLVANLPDAMVALYDRDLIGVMAEGQLVGAGGAPMEQFVGRHISEAIPADRVPAVVALMRAALAGRGGRLEYESGPETVYDVEILPYRDELGEITGAYAIVRSISDRRRAERLAGQAQARFAAIFEEAPIGVVVLDDARQVLEVNRAMVTITGHDPGRLVGLEFPTIFGDDDAAILRRVIGSIGESRHPREVQLRCTHAAGHAVVVDAHVTRLEEATAGGAHTLVQVLDVTDRTHFEDQLQHLAEHDVLTGLANRRRFESDLDRHLDATERYGGGGAVVILDIDHFKQVNDTLGHTVGDRLIVSVADILRSRLRRSDLLARLGGDEFAILLPHVDRAQATLVAEGIVTAVRERAQGQASAGRRRTVTISMGLTMLDERPGHTSETVIADADLAMYDAKESGRDGYAFFSSADRPEPRIKARMAWIERIDDALLNDRFALLAQPILDLRRDEVTQYELLLRMRGDDGALISPAEFLPVAERYDLITRIDAWVVEAAVGLLELHEAAGDGMHLEVNLSGRTIGDAAAVRRIEDIVQAANVDPRNLIFEITETAAVAEMEAARAFADRMRELGCRFALDDFGAGFGSFYYLKHLPFDYLKIDGEFISKSLTNHTDQLVIRSIVQIARGLDKETIAEFVPDRATREMLRDMGVDYAQGYHVGKPAPLPEPGRGGSVPVLGLRG